MKPPIAAFRAVRIRKRTRHAHRFIDVHPGEIGLPRRVLGQAGRGRGRHAGRGLVGAPVPRGGAVRAQAPADARRGGGRGRGRGVLAQPGGLPGRRARHALPRAQRLPLRAEAQRPCAGGTAHGGRARAGQRPRGRGGSQRPRARARAAAGGLRRARAGGAFGGPRAGGHARRSGGERHRVRGFCPCAGGARLPEHRRAGRPRHLRRARRHDRRVPRQPRVPGAAGLLRRRAGGDPPHRAHHRADHPGAAGREHLPRGGVLVLQAGARPRAPEAGAAGRDEPRAARRAGEAGRRPALRRFRHAAAVPVRDHVHVGRLRAPRRAERAFGAALAVRRHEPRLRRRGGTREGIEHPRGRAVRRARGRELRRGAARNLRVHHARGRARGRRAAGEARGGGGASRQAVRSAAQPRGHRLHGGVQRVELPCAPGHEAGVRRPRSADPRDAGRGRGRRRTGRYRQAPSAAGRG